MARPAVAMPTDLRVLQRRRSSEISHINRIRSASLQRLQMPLYETRYPKNLRLQGALHENISKSKLPQSCKFHKSCIPEECPANLNALGYKSENLKGAYFVPRGEKSTDLGNKSKTTQLSSSDENIKTESTEARKKTHGSQNQEKSKKFQGSTIISNKKRHTIRQIDVSNALKQIEGADDHLDVEPERKKSSDIESLEKSENLQKDIGQNIKKTTSSKTLRGVKNKDNVRLPSTLRKTTASDDELNDEEKTQGKINRDIPHDKEIVEKFENLQEEIGKGVMKTSSSKQLRQIAEWEDHLKEKARNKNTAENQYMENKLKSDKSKEDAGRKAKKTGRPSISKKTSKSDDQLDTERKARRELNKTEADDKGSTEDVPGVTEKHAGKISPSKKVKVTPGSNEQLKAEAKEKILTESQEKKNVKKSKEDIEKYDRKIGEPSSLRKTTESSDKLNMTGKTHTKVSLKTADDKESQENFEISSRKSEKSIKGTSPSSSLRQIAKMDDDLKKDAKEKVSTKSQNVENTEKTRESKENIEKSAKTSGQQGTLKKTTESDDQLNVERKKRRKASQTETDKSSRENLQESTVKDVQVKKKQIDHPSKLSKASRQTLELKDNLKSEATEKKPTERQDAKNAGKSLNSRENIRQNDEKSRRSGISEKMTGSKDQLDVEGKSRRKVSGVKIHDCVEKPEIAKEKIRKSSKKTSLSKPLRQIEGSDDDLKDEAKIKHSRENRDKENILKSEKSKEGIGGKAEKTSRARIAKKTSKSDDQLEMEKKAQSKLNKKGTDNKGRSENVLGDTEKHAGKISSSKTVRVTSGSDDHLKTKAKEKTAPESQYKESPRHSRKISRSSTLRKISKSADRLKALIKKPKVVSHTGSNERNIEKNEEKTVHEDIGEDAKKYRASHPHRKTIKLLEKPKIEKDKLTRISSKKRDVKENVKKSEGKDIKRSAAKSKTLNQSKAPISNKDKTSVVDEIQIGELKKDMGLLLKEDMSNTDAYLKPLPDKLQKLPNIKDSPSTKNIIILKWLHGLNCPKSSKDEQIELNSSALTAAPIRILKKPISLKTSQRTDNIPNERKILEKITKYPKNKSPTLEKMKKDKKSKSSNTRIEKEDSRDKPLTHRLNKTQKSSSFHSGKKSVVESESEEKHDDVNIDSATNEGQEVLQKIPSDVEMYVSELGKLEIILSMKSLSPEDVAIIVWLEDIPKEYFTPDFRKPLSITSFTRLQPSKNPEKILRSQSTPDFEDMPVPKPFIYYPSVTLFKNLAVDSKGQLRSLSEDFANSIYYKRCNLSHLE